jgi:hypothetical protein
MACGTCGKNKAKAQELTTPVPHDYVAPDGTRTTFASREDALQARKANAGYGKVVPAK